MNEKEAREIISDGGAEWVSRDYGKAVGYLEAIEKADQIFKKIKETRDEMYENIYDAGGWIKFLDEHLAKWEKEK